MVAFPPELEELLLELDEPPLLELVELLLVPAPLLLLLAVVPLLELLDELLLPEDELEVLPPEELLDELLPLEELLLELPLCAEFSLLVPAAVSAGVAEVGDPEQAASARDASASTIGGKTVSRRIEHFLGTTLSMSCIMYEQRVEIPMSRDGDGSRDGINSN